MAARDPASAASFQASTDEDAMNFASTLSTFEIDLDEYERPLSAARAPQAGAEDEVIAEFARRIAPAARASQAGPDPAPWRSNARSKRRIRSSILWPPSGRATEGPAGTDVETMRIFGSPHEAGLAPIRRSGRRRLAVAALAFGAAATIGALLALEAAAPASPKPMTIAQAPDLTKMQLRGEVTFPAPGPDGATFADDRPAAGSRSNRRFRGTKERPGAGAGLRGSPCSRPRQRRATAA